MTVEAFELLTGSFYQLRSTSDIRGGVLVQVYVRGVAYV